MEILVVVVATGFVLYYLSQQKTATTATTSPKTAAGAGVTATSGAANTALAITSILGDFGKALTAATTVKAPIAPVSGGDLYASLNAAAPSPITDDSGAVLYSDWSDNWLEDPFAS